MTRITPTLAALAAALMTAPVAALAAEGIPQLVDQGIAWLAALFASAVAGVVAAAVTRVTGAALDAKARDTIQTAMERAARLGLEWLLDQAADLPIGQRLSAAACAMLPYVDEGAGDALKRFGLDRSQDARQHLQDMARAELIKQLGSVAPDKLSAALAQATANAAR
ncbi:hypothetical protein [Thioclava sp.]|uniref:hypothetical protein n=1 Tax=Thioclava sp. TaxID=1933450 RepID=UPI0032423418